MSLKIISVTDPCGKCVGEKGLGGDRHIPINILLHRNVDVSHCRLHVASLRSDNFRLFDNTVCLKSAFTIHEGNESGVFSQGKRKACKREADFSKKCDQITTPPKRWAPTLYKAALSSPTAQASVWAEGKTQQPGSSLEKFHRLPSLAQCFEYPQRMDTASLRRCCTPRLLAPHYHIAPKSRSHQCAQILPGKVRLPQSYSRLIPRHLA